MAVNDLTTAESPGPVGYIAMCLAHIRAGYPIDELATGLVLYVAPTQADIDHARHMAQALASGWLAEGGESSTPPPLEHEQAEGSKVTDPTGPNRP